MTQEQSLEQIFDRLDEGSTGKEKRSLAIEFVCSDMWKPYLNVIERRCPLRFPSEVHERNDNVQQQNDKSNHPVVQQKLFDFLHKENTLRPRLFSLKIGYIQPSQLVVDWLAISP